MYLVRRFTGGVLIFIISVVTVVGVWMYAPALITDLLDFNLQAIKTVASWMPADSGHRFATTVRLLAGEKALLFAEAAVFWRTVFFLLSAPFR